MCVVVDAVVAVVVDVGWWCCSLLTSIHRHDLLRGCKSDVRQHETPRPTGSGGNGFVLDVKNAK